MLKNKLRTTVLLLSALVLAATFSAGAAFAAAPPASFADLVAKVGPAVVNIRAVKSVKVPGFSGQAPFGPNSDPRDLHEFFRRFFGEGGGGMPQERKMPALGTGVIVDKDGHVLTNYHVVSQAKEIMVKLKNGKEYPAKVLGRDKLTDLALLKIKAKTDLPFLPMGDSDKLRVGDWVIAVGNPFGLENSVTAGIVSAKGRFVGTGPYDDYIQTDASINPGNSGGPLISLEGKLVGINTLKHRGGDGIGFSIPSNLVKSVMEQLKAKGKVVRGWLGIRFQPMTEELAKKFGLDEARGALVAEVFPGSPADKGGMKAGDVVVALDGKKVKAGVSLARIVALTPVGTEVKVSVLRKGKEKVLKVVLGDREKGEIAANGGQGGGDQGGAGPAELGLSLQTLTPEMAKQLGAPGKKGVIVTAVNPGSPAAEAGLQRGDIVIEAAQEPVDTAAKLASKISQLKKGDGLLLFVQRRQGTLFVVLKKP